MSPRSTCSVSRDGGGLPYSRRPLALGGRPRTGGISGEQRPESRPWDGSSHHPSSPSLVLLAWTPGHPSLERTYHWEKSGGGGKGNKAGKLWGTEESSSAGNVLVIGNRKSDSGSNPKCIYFSQITVSLEVASQGRFVSSLCYQGPSCLSSLPSSKWWTSLLQNGCHRSRHHNHIQREEARHRATGLSFISSFYLKSTIPPKSSLQTSPSMSMAKARSHVLP